MSFAINHIFKTGDANSGITPGVIAYTNPADVAGSAVTLSGVTITQQPAGSGRFFVAATSPLDVGHYIDLMDTAPNPDLSIDSAWVNPGEAGALTPRDRKLLQS